MTFRPEVDKTAGDVAGKLEGHFCLCLHVCTKEHPRFTDGCFSGVREWAKHSNKLI